MFPNAPLTLQCFSGHVTAVFGHFWRGTSINAGSAHAIGCALQLQAVCFPVLGACDTCYILFGMRFGFA